MGWQECFSRELFGFGCRIIPTITAVNYYLDDPFVRKCNYITYYDPEDPVNIMLENLADVHIEALRKKRECQVKAVQRKLRGV